MPCFTSRFDASKTLAKPVEDPSASFCCEDSKAACVIIAQMNSGLYIRITHYYRVDPPSISPSACRYQEEDAEHPRISTNDPVAKSARTQYRYASAMSWGVDTNPTGSTFAAFSNSSFCCSFVFPMLSHSSVCTSPGTTQFTRIFFSARSPASPLVRDMTPPFRAPPTAAPLPGLTAAMPDVKVSEPPVRMISCLSTATNVSNTHSECAIHTFSDDNRTPELNLEKMFCFIKVKIL
jgi:hypothetical protein